MLRGTTPAIVGIGVALYLLGLDAVEPLSQEIDHPDHTDGVPIDRGWMIAHHIAAPALALVPFALLGAATVGRVRARRRGAGAGAVRAGDAGSACAGAVISIVRDAPDPLAPPTAIVGGRAAGVRRVHVDDPAAYPLVDQRRSPGCVARRARAARRRYGRADGRRAAHRGRRHRVVDPQARRVAGQDPRVPGRRTARPGGRRDRRARDRRAGQDVRRRAGAGADRPQVAAGRAGRAARPQRQRQDDAAADGRRAARADRRARRSVLGSPVGSLEARAATSYLGDQPVFYDDLSVWEHLEYIAKLHGHDDWEGHATDLLETVGLLDRRDDLPMTFSRGLRQKAAIALAFIRPFELLLVDEPFVGLDRTGRDALLDLLRPGPRRRRRARRGHPRADDGRRGPAPRRPPRRRARLRRRRRRAPTSTPSSPAEDARDLVRHGWLGPGVTVSAMYEFDSVSVSTYEAASLAAKLTEKSADGWEVVAIVPAGQRHHRLPEATATDAAARRARAPAQLGEHDRRPPRPTAAAASRPGGAPRRGRRAAPAGAQQRRRQRLVVGLGRRTSAATAAGGAPAPRRRSGSRADAPAQPATPSVPAGWYHDPAGRFELRYWDGSAWTEHVSRAGQQYTDPPVA